MAAVTLPRVAPPKEPRIDGADASLLLPLPSVTRRGSTRANATNTGPCAITRAGRRRGTRSLILVMCYVFECILSPTPFLVSLKRNRESLKAHIQQVKRSRPVITMRIRCYHHETRHWRDNKGTTSKQVRVNTHAASHVYHYSWVRDSGGDAYEHAGDAAGQGRVGAVGLRRRLHAPALRPVQAALHASQPTRRAFTTRSLRP